MDQTKDLISEFFLGTCDSAHFQCVDGQCKYKDVECEGPCIPKSWYNDGVDDCTDGSDEDQGVSICFFGQICNTHDEQMLKILRLYQFLFELTIFYMGGSSKPPGGISCVTPPWMFQLSSNFMTLFLSTFPTSH